MRNSVHLIGRLGGAPTIKTLESGTTLATFSLATSEYYTNKAGQRAQSTYWHNVVAWNRLAEIAGQFLKKGSTVSIEGQLIYREHQPKEGGYRKIAEIKASKLTLL